MVFHIDFSIIHCLNMEKSFFLVANLQINQVNTMTDLDCDKSNQN